MAENELIRETPWSKEYRQGPGSFLFESKFAREGLQVSAEFVRVNWSRWDPAEQLSFANAYMLKPALSSEDDEVITFLMEHGTEPVWASVSHLLPRHPDRERVVSFLLERLVARNRFAAAYFQALADIGDPRAIPALRQRFQEYRATLSPLLECESRGEIEEYLSCCLALWRLEGSAEYEDSVMQLFSHPDVSVRHAAQKMYVEKKLHYLVPPLEARRHPPPAAGPEQPHKETEWSRVYLGQFGYCWYTSKFRTDGLQVSAASLRERWPGLPLEEQVEFAASFGQKPAFSDTDLRILQLLIEQGPELVRTTIAHQLRGHPDLDTVLPRLLEGIRSAGPVAVGYCEALRLIGDPRAVAPIRERYELYRKELVDPRQGRMDQLAAYLVCCHALRMLTGSKEYQTALEELLLHPDQQVRREVLRLLPSRNS